MKACCLILAVLAAGFTAPRWASLTVTEYGALLAWHPVAEAIGYRVWRLDRETGEWSAFDTTRDTTYLDRGFRASETDFHYRVSGVDSELDESPLSPARNTGESESIPGRGDDHGGNM